MIQLFLSLGFFSRVSQTGVLLMSRCALLIVMSPLATAQPAQNLEQVAPSTYRGRNPHSLISACHKSLPALSAPSCTMFVLLAGVWSWPEAPCSPSQSSRISYLYLQERQWSASLTSPVATSSRRITSYPSSSALDPPTSSWSFHIKTETLQYL